MVQTLGGASSGVAASSFPNVNISNKTDLKNWAGNTFSKVGIIQQAFNIDEDIDIDCVDGRAALIDVPPQTHKLTLAAGCKFNILNTAASDVNRRAFHFKDLYIDGNGVATNAITTVNSAAALRLYFAIIEGCRFENFTTATNITLELQNCEDIIIRGNSFGSSRNKIISFTSAGGRGISNDKIYDNEFVLYSGANPATGIYAEHDLTFCHDNHFLGKGDESVLSLAYEFSGSAAILGYTRMVSDRFEACKVLETTNFAGTTIRSLKLIGCDIERLTNSDVRDLVTWQAKTRACEIIDSYIGLGGGAGTTTAVHDYNVTAAGNVWANRIMNCVFKGFTIGGGANPYLTKEAGVNTTEANVVYGNP